MLEKNGQILRVTYAKSILGPRSGPSGSSQSSSLAAAAIEAATFSQQVCICVYIYKCIYLYIQFAFAFTFGMFASWLCLVGNVLKSSPLINVMLQNVWGARLSERKENKKLTVR